MKHNQKLLGLAGIILACNLCLVACQSQPSQQEKSKYKVKTKQEVKKKSKATKKGQVPGVDKPTDDGFLFKSESQIKARTSEGLILEHDGHTHFIFYSDLKNSKWAYLIPKDGQVTAGSGQLANQMSIADDGYVFNPRDIVSEDQYGYVVRHGDHFHYILKQSVGNLAQAPSYRPTPSSNTTGPVDQPTLRPSVPQQQGTTKRQFAGIDYPTSDGFLFRGTGVTGKLATGLLADHNGHTHFIPYEQLIGSSWESLIPAEHKKAAEDAYYGRQGQAQPSPEPLPAPAPAPTPDPAPNPLDEEKEIAKKKAYLAQQLGIDESLIQVSDTDKGKVFIYPHGDHSHSTLVSEIDTTKHFDPHGNPHAHDAVGMATLKTLGFDDEIIEDILHATADTPFPSDETDTEKMKAWLATVKYLNIGQRKDPLERKGLELMPNIEVLGIGFTPIKDIRPVLQFKHLKQLWMTKTGVTNYDFLKEIPTLEGLDISQNGITDLSFLKDYPNLKTVAAAGNDLTDISPLAKLKNLESLNLDYNNISDISALTKLSKLKAVSLEHNQLQDVSALSQKEDLTRLFLSNNPNLNLNTLKASHLEELTADNSNVESLNFLKSNPNLTTLSLNGNRLTSLTGVEAAKNLVTLSASQNKIKTLDTPAAQSSLKNLNLGENELKNLEGINQFRALDNLAVNKNKITTLALKESNKTVTYINVSDNHIPKEELELNENKIPKALAQHFPDVQGGSIDNNKPADAKDEKKEEPKQSEPNNADVQGNPASDKPASAEASVQVTSNDNERPTGSSEVELNNRDENPENSSKPSSEELPTTEKPELKDELAQAENKENQKDPKDKEKAEKEASH
ncbi:pneumococcal-type histidine triad protein [Streptococcus sp. IsoGale022]|uniref:pneumococcal-type histidine triad protein n=1 Tax=Streptococcus sp. IsoGale022 TaxID=2923524 RepID=UPI0028101E16|nr:pneumococcal-type histidine triad protein [Streptococcus sp. IsoGale022]MDQ8693274.1 pneumococcal-type histidine triad protein [Streptococcus sp. IsoGale022]